MAAAPEAGPHTQRLATNPYQSSRSLLQWCADRERICDERGCRSRRQQPTLRRYRPSDSLAGMLVRLSAAQRRQAVAPAASPIVYPVECHSRLEATTRRRVAVPPPLEGTHPSGGFGVEGCSLRGVSSGSCSPRRSRRTHRSSIGSARSHPTSRRVLAKSWRSIPAAWTPNTLTTDSTKLWPTLRQVVENSGRQCLLAGRLVRCLALLVPDPYVCSVETGNCAIRGWFRATLWLRFQVAYRRIFEGIEVVWIWLLPSRRPRIPGNWGLRGGIARAEDLVGPSAGIIVRISLAGTLVIGRRRSDCEPVAEESGGIALRKWPIPYV